MRQLAALAGVSRTTISLALRNHPSIPTATRDRIQHIARQNGYRHDPLITTLMNELRKSRKKRFVEKIAYLTSWNKEDEWRKSPNDVHFYHGACKRATELGYEIEPVWAKQPGVTKARLSNILYTRGIRGVIIAPLLRPVGHFTLSWERLAASTISYTIFKPNLHRCTHSHFSGMVTTLRNLKHKGYNRIGLAYLTDSDQRVGHGWQAAYLHYYYNSPADRQIAPLLSSKWDPRQFEKWLERYKPDAVVSNGQEPLLLLQKAGYRVPQDIGYANLDLVPGTSYSGIDQLPDHVGAVAVDLVARQLHNNEFGLPPHALTVQIDGLWKNGTTTMMREEPRTRRGRRAGLRLQHVDI